MDIFLGVALIFLGILLGAYSKRIAFWFTIFYPESMFRFVKIINMPMTIVAGSVLILIGILLILSASGVPILNNGRLW